ncbi:hypothetical protein AAG570_009437 [Ranatra chinensis]|uniref:Uncharacterized protein n=1 Tax=Ranatra chinensis TaxID=642074 RepID=A0ABD0YP52_9HEMI
MASKRRNMFYQNKKQETTEIERDENRDREIILQNLEYMIDGTEDLNLVLQKLVNKRMLDEKIRAEIEDNDADERKKKLYLLLAKCGPSAVINLQECFKEMGWNVLQDVLGKRMSSSPMGVALVINIDIETCEEEKRGMEMDVNNIINLWKALGYKVVIRKDLTKRQFEYEVKAFSCMTELNEVDSMAIILMTHGPKPDDADGIFACDKGIIRYEWIVKQFEVPNCSQLMGKPKLFFLYSCCFLSSDSANYGSCMMEGICEVFKHHAHEEHIETMMKFVNKFLQFQGEEISNDNILTFENRGFNKDLYFYPGLQD